VRTLGRNPVFLWIAPGRTVRRQKSSQLFVGLRSDKVFSV
jgi:hypothetical protein